MLYHVDSKVKNVETRDKNASAASNDCALRDVDENGIGCIMILLLRTYYYNIIICFSATAAAVRDVA